MVENQLAARGVTDLRVLDAMRRVPRHLFVPDDQLEVAYSDGALPIGYGGTISQPIIVAHMTELLNLSGGEKVLEVGAGSGYQAAILADLGAKLTTIERVPELAEQARQNLSDAGYEAKVVVGDGTLGWPEDAPYDRIVFTASVPRLPRSYEEQIAPGGLIVGPVGTREAQELMVFEKTPDGDLRRHYHGGCVFIPMVGDQGWPEHDKGI